MKVGMKMKVNEVKKLIKRQLDTLKDEVKEVYYRDADDDVLYPHITFEYDTISGLGDDLNRQDYMLIIDVWDKQKESVLAEDIADRVEELFSAVNLPQETILPTFYFENRKFLKDEDKEIKHIQLKFSIQNYERK